MTMGPRLHDALAWAIRVAQIFGYCEGMRARRLVDASHVDSADAPVPSSTALAVRTGLTI